MNGLSISEEYGNMEKKEIEEAVLQVFEVSLEAQLKALKRLRSGQVEKKPPRQRTSQVDMVYEVLSKASEPLHVSEIINRIEKIYGIRPDRDSIVSSLVKKVQRGDRFIRTDKNVFGLKGEK
jgi:hypothetical protein